MAAENNNLDQDQQQTPVQTPIPNLNQIADMSATGVPLGTNGAGPGPASGTPGVAVPKQPLPPKVPSLGALADYAYAQSRATSQFADAAWLNPTITPKAYVQKFVDMPGGYVKGFDNEDYYA